MRNALVVSITHPHNGFTSVDLRHPHGSIDTAVFYRDPFQREHYLSPRNVLVCVEALNRAQGAR